VTMITSGILYSLYKTRGESQVAHAK